ncbi:MAG: EamA/RhaT family transporter [Chloroflexota bacterium]|nr:MAG: EamA/RhaT family transporter [Chloroflexota bacterium]
MALAVFFGLFAALFWGAADFTGGVASKRANVYRVLLTGEWSGLLFLLPLPFIFHEPLPSWQDLLLSAFASTSGVFGLAMLYRSLSEGQMSVAAPVSALLAAVIPVIVSVAVDGYPGALKMAGFALTLAAIWLISSDDGIGKALRLRWTALRLPLLAGLAFGLYFVLMNISSRQAAYWPLVSARLAGTLAMAAYLLLTRRPAAPPRPVFWLAIMCGVLDVIANASFVLAGQAGRLDVAAVLGSLYPGTTVLLAGILLKERLNFSQLAGIAAALVAIALIAY